MGNVEDKLVEGIDYDFVGRKDDLERISQYLSQDTVRIIGLFGIMKIGKSRLLDEFIKRNATRDSNEQWCLIDFNNENVTTANSLYKCFIRLMQYLEIESSSIDRDSFKSSEITACENCRKCRKDPPTGECEQFEKNAANLIVNGVHRKTVLCLDNIDCVINSKVKDIFHKFLEDVAKKSKHVTFIVTSSHKIASTGPYFKVHEVWPMSTEEITFLLHKVTEYQLDTEDDRYVQAIAKICQGLPLAALMAGSELKEDDGFMKPRELLEIMITNRLEALSPDIYPADDQLEIYKTPIEEANNLAPHFAAFFHRLNSGMEGQEFTVHEAKDAVAEDQATNAVIKKFTLKPLLNRNVMSVYDARKDILTLPPVFRECITALNAIDGLNEEDLQTMITTHMRDHAKSLNLELTDDELSNPIELENAILRLNEGPYSGRVRNEPEEMSFSIISEEEGENKENAEADQHMLNPVDTFGGNYEMILHEHFNDDLSSLSGPTAMRFVPSNGESVVT